MCSMTASVVVLILVLTNPAVAAKPPSFWSYDRIIKIYASVYKRNLDITILPSWNTT